MNSVVTDKNVQKTLFINIFSLSSGIIVFFYGIFNVILSNKLTGVVEIGAGVLLLSIPLFLRLTKNIELSSSFFLVIVFLFFAFTLYNGGLQNTGILWFYTYPLISFYLKGHAKGLYFTLAFLFYIGLNYALYVFDFIALPYKHVMIMQIFISLSAISILLYIYAYFQDKTENSLRDSEKRYRELTDLLPVAVTETDINGYISLTNKYGLKETGYTQEDIDKGIHITQLLPENERRMALSSMNKILNGEEIPANEYNIIRKDGTTIKMISFSAPFYVHGDLGGMRSVMINITEQNNLLELYKQSEKKYQELSELLPIVIYQIDLTGKFTYVNKYGFEITGYDKNDFKKGIYFSEIVVEEDKSKLEKVFKELLSGNDTHSRLGFESSQEYDNYSLSSLTSDETISNEYTVVSKTGDTFPILSFSTPIIKQGEIIGIRGAAFNIAKQKKAENLYKQSEMRFRDLTNLLPIIIYEADINSKLIFANQYAMKKTGYDIKDVENGIYISEIIHKDYIEKAKKYIKKVLAGNVKALGIEYLIKKKDGSTFFASAYSAAIIENGKVTGLRGALFDITEIKKTQKERDALIRSLEKALVEAEKANKLKEELITIMSHEIRTPLSSMVGFSDLMLDDETLSADQKENTRYINESAHRLNDLLTNLLELSVIHSGSEPEINNSDFDIEAVIKGIYTLLKVRIEEKNINFNYEIHCQSSMFSDPLRIQQILFNLIGNAVKFTENGNVDVTLNKNDGNYIFKVSDTGVGIDKDKQDEIFDIFTQLDMSLVRKHEGVGIGLSLCKKFTDALGGKINVKSEPGKGSEFTLTIPVKEN